MLLFYSSLHLVPVLSPYSSSVFDYGFLYIGFTTVIAVFRVKCFMGTYIGIPLFTV
ncbi:hypothetical protein Holit_02464 [Hollandina sp. SP2]